MTLIAKKLAAAARVLRHVRDRQQAWPVCILTYHRVADLARDPQLLAVGKRNFSDQMSYLHDNYRVIGFADDFSATRDPSVVITFDDGYQDNFSNALPVLQQFGMPATFFVATGLIGTERRFWWDEVEVLCAAAGSGRRGYRQWIAELRDLQPEQRGARLGELRRRHGPGTLRNDSQRCMSVEELRMLAAARGVDIGAHTVHHPRMAMLGYRQQLEEMADSRRQLEQWIGRPVRSFAYPYGGRGDFNDDSVAACGECGFDRAAANYHGQLYPWTDRYRIPRHVVRNWNLREFRYRMKLFRYL